LLTVIVSGICIAERADAVKDLQNQIEELTSSRSGDVSKALAQQSEEIDFLKAELTSTKVRLHDALSHSQAEKDALIRHADASRAELLQQLEELRGQYCAVNETQTQSSVDASECPHVTPSKCSDEHVPEVEAVSGNIDNSASLWKKFELMRELVKCEKEKWNLQQAYTSDSDQLDAAVPDAAVNEVAQSHKIRSSWVVLEEQVLPLMEKFCAVADQTGNGEAVKNRGFVVENQENETPFGEGDGKVYEQDKNLHTVGQQLEEERQEVIRLTEVINKMQDSVHAKNEAGHEIETKHAELQVELDSVREQLQSQEKLNENLSANVESANEQLKHRMAELSDKDSDIHKLNAELAELKEQITQKLLVLQTECDEKLDSERKTWQAQIDAKTDELSAKCAELERHELTLKTLADQCSMLTVERDAKTAELVNSSTQIDSLTMEISVLKEQLSDKTVALFEAQTRTEHERKLLKNETECEMLVLKSKVTALEDEIGALQEQLENKSTDLVKKDEALTLLENRSVTEREEFLAKLAGLEDQLIVQKSKITALEDEIIALKEQLESKTIDLVKKDEALTLLENRCVTEREEFQAKITGLEDQLSSDQKSSVEQLNSLMKEVNTKEMALREQEEEHVAYCKLTDTRLAELSAAVGAKEDEIKSLLEHHKEKCEMSNEEMAKVTSANEEKLAHLNSQIDVLTTDKHDLESELQLLQDKLKFEYENFAQSEKEVVALKEQLESKTIDLVKKDEALNLLENRCVAEREEFQAKVTALEDQLIEQKSKITALEDEIVALKEELESKSKQEEEYVAYCKLTDTKVAELSAAVSAKEDEIKSLLEHQKTELLEKCEISNEEMAKVTSANDEKIADLNRQIDVLTTDKHNLESELQLLQDKWKFESENVAQLEKERTELSLVKDECERQLEDLRGTVPAETEQMIKLRDEQITALKSALSDKDHGLSLLTAALSQTCSEDVHLMDSTSCTVVASRSDTEVLDAGSGDADHAAPELCGDQLCTQNYDVPMMVYQINSLGAANTALRTKIGRLEADLLQIRQTDVKPVGESPQPELTSLHQPPMASHSSG